jgi:hypothetical protein
MVLTACLISATLIRPGGTRSAGEQAGPVVTLDPTAGDAGSLVSISALNFPEVADQHAATIQFDLNVQIHFDVLPQWVTIGQQLIAQCSATPNPVYGFGASCGTVVQVPVPNQVPAGPHTVRVHVPVPDGTIDVETTFTVIAANTATPSATETATATATGTTSATATQTATGVPSASSTSTALATATNTPSATGTAVATATQTATGVPSASPTRTAPATTTPTRTATATVRPIMPVIILVKRLFTIGKLVLTVDGPSSATIEVSLVVERRQHGALGAVYQGKKTGVLDAKGSFFAELPIKNHDRSMITLRVIVRGPAKDVLLSRIFRYSG